MKKIFGLAVASAATITLAACGDDSKVGLYDNFDAGVYLNTYVADSGQTAKEVVFVSEGDYASDVAVEDLKITYSFAADGFYVMENYTEDYTIDHDDVSVSVVNNAVVISIPEVTTGSLNEAKIAIDATGTDFDAVYSDMTVRTETVDDFVQSTYTATNGIGLNYWLYMPENASNNSLMVWEHGGGEYLSSSYEGAQMYANRGATSWVEADSDMAVLSVQYVDNYAYELTDPANAAELELMEKYNDAKVEFINTLVADGKIDVNKINIAGASSGGGNTMRFIMQYPEYFASATIMCLKDVITPISYTYTNALNYSSYTAASETELAGYLEISETDRTTIYDLTKTEITSYLDTNGHTIDDLPPIWFLAAKYDEVCHTVATDAVIAALGGVSDKVKYTEYSYDEMQGNANVGFGHLVWIPALNDADLISWVGSQTKA